MTDTADPTPRKSGAGRIAWRVLAVVLVCALAWLLRARAAQLLPIDFDEDDYMRAAQQYAVAMQSGDPATVLAALTTQNYRPEHPPLAKIVYGAVLAQLPPIAEIPDRSTSAEPDNKDPFLPRTHLLPVRLSAAALATAQAALLALANPLAGLLLALHTYQIKYTSQVMLEALPALTSMLCALAWLRWKARGNPAMLIISAAMLGLTAAAKYLYCIVAVAIVLDGLLDARAAGRLRRWAMGVAGWAAIALLVFVAADPYLWPAPVDRLLDSVLYHSRYSQGADVQRAGFPFWQPLVYLSSSFFFNGNRDGIFLLTLDVGISALALFGFRAVWRTQRVMVLWFVIALAFLFVWNTKWPQYLLILTTPLTWMAAAGLRGVLVEPVMRAIDNLRNNGLRSRVTAHSPARRDTLRALPWLLPGALVLTVLAAAPLLYQIAMALTDFSTASIRDGIRGGVMREALQGLLGWLPASEPFANSDGKVHFVGAALLTRTFGAADGLIGFALGFSVLWTALSVTGQTLLGVSVALLLNKPGVKLAALWRALFIIPWAIPEFVGGIAWRTLVDERAGLLALLNQAPVDWRQDSVLSFAILLLAGTWAGFPIMMLAAGTALKMIPPGAADAAAVDGAGRWATLRWITLPLMLPILMPALIIRAISAFNQLYLFYAMFAPTGTLATASYFLFTPLGGVFGSRGGLYAVSAALNLFIIVVLIIFMLRFNRASKAIEGVIYA